MWISPEFKIYIVKEFQRLKTEEQRLLGWSAKRELSKINYRIHTDAIKQNLVPPEVTPSQASVIYANEADVLNVAMFGVTASNGARPIPNSKGTSAIMLQSMNLSACQIWETSMRFSSSRASLRVSGL